MRLTPIRLRPGIYWRVYRGKRDRYPHLYNAAPLHYAPGFVMRLSPTDEGHGHIAFAGVFESELSRLLVRRARAGGTLVDVGANYGYFSLLWAAQNPINRVIAFEASPLNRDPLADNISRNGVGDRVELRWDAVGAHVGDMEFELGPQEQTGWGGLSVGSAGDTQRVRVVRLDEELQSLDTVDVLKIDIEGADTWALMGAEQLLREHRIAEVYYEENKPRMRALGIEPGSARTLLRSLGYRVNAMTPEADDLAEYHASIVQ